MEEPTPKRIKSTCNGNDVKHDDSPHVALECCTNDNIVITTTVPTNHHNHSPTTPIISPSTNTCSIEVTKFLSDVPSDIFQTYVFPFVGRHQYRFIVSINRILYQEYTSYLLSSLKTMYLIENTDDVPSNRKTTYINGSTLEHTKICYTEMKHNHGSLYYYNDKHDINLCKSAALSGNIESMQYLYNMGCYWDNSSVCAAAAQSGSIPTLQYLHDNGCPWDKNKIYNGAVRSNNLDMLMFVTEQKCKCDAQTCGIISEYGHIYLLQQDLEHSKISAMLGHVAQYGHLHILQQYRSKLDWHVYKAAAVNGRLRILQWWYNELDTTNLPLTFDPKTSHQIAMRGHYHIIQWILQNTSIRFQFNSKCSKHLCSEIARHGNIQLLQFVREQGCISWTAKTCANAALHGHLDLLQYVRNHGCPWSGMTCAYAARRGHLHILEWARQHGCPWSATTCKYAAMNGQLTILKWARDHNCPWDYKTCECAAIYGHIHVLQWARNNGLKGWKDNKVDRSYTINGRNALHCACESGNFEMVQYLIEVCNAHQNETDERECTPLALACDSGHLKVVQYLLEKNSLRGDEFYETSMGKPLRWALNHGHFNICKYLIEFGGSCPLQCTMEGDNALDIACKNGYYKIARYLLENYTMPWNKKKAANYATKNGHTFLTKYILTGE